MTPTTKPAEGLQRSDSDSSNWSEFERLLAAGPVAKEGESAPLAPTPMWVHDWNNLGEEEQTQYAKELCEGLYKLNSSMNPVPVRVTDAAEFYEKVKANSAKFPSSLLEGLPELAVNE